MGTLEEAVRDQQSTAFRDAVEELTRLFKIPGSHWERPLATWVQGISTNPYLGDRERDLLNDLQVQLFG